MSTTDPSSAEGTWWCANGHQCNRGSTICHTCGFTINDEKAMAPAPTSGDTEDLFREFMQISVPAKKDDEEIYNSLYVKTVRLIRSLEAQNHSLKAALDIIHKEADEACLQEMKNKGNDNKHNPYALNQFMNIRATAESSLFPPESR